MAGSYYLVRINGELDKRTNYQPLRKCISRNELVIYRADSFSQSPDGMVRSIQNATGLWGQPVRMIWWILRTTPDHD
jgi:hypothetical protein